MLRWIILRVLARAEASLGESLDYARFILGASLGAFFKFARLTGVSNYRRALPLGPFHVVRMVAARHEDCGPCVQTTVNVARRAGVPASVLRAVVDGRPEDLPEELADTYLFVMKVLEKTYDEGDLREKIRGRYRPHGDAALAEIALVLSSARAYPVTKRVLGFATSCKKVTVDLEGMTARPVVAR